MDNVAAILGEKYYGEKPSERDPRGRFGRGGASTPRSPMEAYPPERTAPNLDWTDVGLSDERPDDSVFTDEDVDGMLSYFGQAHSFELNGWLRGDGSGLGPQVEKEMSEVRDALDSAMAHAGSPGVPLRVFRSLQGSEGGIPAEFGMAPGKTLIDRGFGSTSGYQEHAEGFGNIHMELTVHPEVKSIWGANPEEEELLLERGVRYVIESVTKRRTLGWSVKATVLPPV
jgi:hypothetical protein